MQDEEEPLRQVAGRAGLMRKTGVAIPFGVALILTCALIRVSLPALGIFFTGDDFELFALAREGGLRGAMLAAPARGTFLKPVVNAAWAVAVPLLGPDARAWHVLLLATHLLDAALLGFFCARLARHWGVLPDRDENRGVSLPACAGFAAAVLFAAHDRLFEPLRSIASWNHSLTLALYLGALIALERALARRSRPALWASALFVLLTLLAYEVGLSVLAAGLGLILLHPRGAWRERARFAGPALLGAGSLYLLARVIIRRGAEAEQYRFATHGLFEKSGQVLSAFVHWNGFEPGGWANVLLALFALLFAAAGWVGGNRMVRFGILWSAAAILLISPIPTFSDRYDYIPFAGLTLALCGAAGALVARLHRARPAALLIGALLLGLHVAAGGRGMARQSEWDRARGAQHLGFVNSAREQWSRARASLPADGVLLLAWDAEPQAPPPGRPAYVRPDGVGGLIYPADLMNFVGADRGEFFRVPDPRRTARAIDSGAVTLIDLRANLATVAAGAAGEALRAEVIQSLSLLGEVPRRLDGTALAWLEPTDRDGAFRAEYLGENR